MKYKYIFHKKLILQSDIKSLKRLLSISKKIFKKFSKSNRCLYRYLICLDEIFSNCIFHGYKSCKGIIEIEYKIYGNWLITDICDYGQGISKELTGSLDFLKENNYNRIKDKIGYGLIITSYLADKVIIGRNLHGGTKVSLYFSINN